MISSRIRIGKNIVLAIAGALFAILLGFGISAQTQLFSDDFQDGNDSGWAKSSGTWAVVTDGSLAYRQSGTSADSNARNGSPSWTNISVQARVKPISFNGADRYVGVMSRVVNSNHYYFLALQNGNRLLIGKRAGSTPIILATKSFTFSTGTFLTLRLDANGSSLTGFVNGTQQLTASDSEFTAGIIGGATFFASASFDDFLVTSIGGGGGNPPAAPTGLVATAGNAQVTLNWNASSGASSYNVKRSTTSGGPYTTIATGVTSTSYTNTGLANGTTYFYVISAVNAVGESGNSNQASATPQNTQTPPAAPAGLIATAGSAQVSLSWSASSRATSYNVKRSTTNGGPYSTIASGVTSTNYTNTGLTNGTTYFYVVSAVNSFGESGNSNQASATPTATSTETLYDLAGFARAATGGGLTPESDPNYRKVFTADDLVAALGNRNTKVIEIMNDLDLGFNEVPATARTGALRSASAPLLHPALLTSGVSLIDIQDKNGLTIFSANGATIRHATFNVKRANNMIIRNLKFDELWEWDESTKGKYDKQGWDFITVDMTSDNIWIDHCSFTKVYDGVVDIKGGTRNVTISWCSFLGDDGGSGSFVRRQIEALEQNRPANPMYDFLRSNGFSVEDIIAISRSQKKGHLVGANELDPANANHQVTLHHNYYLNMQDRLPRLRAGNAHAYNLYINNAEAFAAKGARDAIVAAMTPSNAAKLTGSNATFSFDVVLNGAISTEGGAVLLEKSQLIGVIFPLRNNQKDATLTEFTGKILALDTLYQRGSLVFRGDSNTPGSPLAPVPAPELAFSWNGFATLPYVYTTHDPTQLPPLLTGSEGAGAGKLIWAKENWLKTSY
jgi:pectate lyase